MPGRDVRHAFRSRSTGDSVPDLLESREAVGLSGAINSAYFLIIIYRLYYYGALLEFDSETAHGLVKVLNLNFIQAELERLQKDFPNLFKGFQVESTQVKLHIDRSVRPMAQQRRHCTPFHLRNKVERELEKLLSEDIIEEVEGESHNLGQSHCCCAQG